MESFFLSETIKYLYLLFDEDNFIHKTPASLSQAAKDQGEGDCLNDSGVGYIFNTEAHPLDPGLIHCCSAQHVREEEILESSGDLVNPSSSAVVPETLMEDFDETFAEILTPAPTWTGGDGLTNELNHWLINLWQDLNEIAISSNGELQSNTRPLNYTSPDLFRRGKPPLMSCPTVSFKTLVQSMKDMDFRSLYF